MTIDYTKMLSYLADFTAMWRKKYVFTMKDMLASLRDPDLYLLIDEYKEKAGYEFLNGIRDLDALSPQDFERIFIESMNRLIEMKRVVKQEQEKFAWIGH